VRAAAGLNDPQFAISALSLAALSWKSPARKPSVVNTQSASVICGYNTPSLAEAIAITKRVLEMRRAVSPDTAIKQSFLRGMLVAEDPRLALNPADLLHARSSRMSWVMVFATAGWNGSSSTTSQVRSESTLGQHRSQRFLRPLKSHHHQALRRLLALRTYRRMNKRTRDVSAPQR
jgi:hypothetical protein